MGCFSLLETPRATMITTRLLPREFDLEGSRILRIRFAPARLHAL